MNNEVYINQVLDDFLHGKLTRAEAGQQLLKLDAGIDVNREIEMHQAAVAALQRYRILVQVRNVHAQFVADDKNDNSDSGHKSSARVARIKPIKWIIRVAAVFILAAGGWFAYLYSTNSSSKLYAEIYQPYNLNTDRSGDELIPHNMLQQFKEKDYAAVIKTFQSLPATNNREKFLTAIAWQETGNYQQAIDLLKQVLLYNSQHGTRLYNDEAEFYLGLGYLKMKNGKAALPWFQKIYQDPNHTFHERVSRWTITKLAWLKQD